MATHLKAVLQNYVSSKDCDPAANLSEETEHFRRLYPAKNTQSTDAIPKFYFKVPADDDVIQQRLREEARSNFLQRRNRQLLKNDELKELWILLDKHQLSIKGDEGYLNYENFLKISSQCEHKYKKYFSPSVFAKLQQPDSYGKINTTSLFNYIMRKVWLHQTRIGLSIYDSSGEGYLKQEELENYIKELIPTLPQLDGLEKSFHMFYICTAVRKFMFFLDPLHTGRVRIQDILACGFLDQLIEEKQKIHRVYGGFIDSIIVTNVNTLYPHYMEWFLRKHPPERSIKEMAYSGELTGCVATLLRDEELSKESQASNWFSASSALRVYGDYLNLDRDHNGMLSKEELSGYGTGSLTRTFIDRVFQECLTFEGEIDYKTYLDFVLALENRHEPQSQHYLFRILDIHGKGFLDTFCLRYYFKAIQKLMEIHGQEPVPFENVQNEIFDMVKPAQPDRITLKDLLNCEQGDTVLSILIDLNGFWNHENREMMAAETTTDISRK